MDSMLSTLDKPRTEISKMAPQIHKLKVNPQKVGDIIGRGGETINKIIEETGVEIDIQDEGLVIVSSPPGNSQGAKDAIAWIENLTQEPEVGKVYNGKVVKIMDFGAFVQLFPGTDGLVHISELADHRVEKVTDVVQEGEVIKVKLLSIDDKGRLQLSKIAAEKESNSKNE